MLLIMKVDFKPYNDTPFNVSFQFSLGLPGVVNCAFSTGAPTRTRQSGQDKPDAFHLMTVESNGVRAERGGGNFQLRRGEATLLHLAEAGNASAPAQCGGIGVIMPRTEFETRNVRPDGALLQRLTPRCEALRLLRSYVHSVEHSKLDERAAAMGGPTVLHEIAQRHIYDLAALVVARCDTVGESSLSAVSAARLRAALNYIAAHSSDPLLTVDVVARDQGISPRYLQRLMEASGYSCTAVINKIRLQKAFTALTEAEQRGRTILDIAMQTGFTDISYFNRLFRAQFGDTPSGVRARSEPVHGLGQRPPRGAYVQ